MQEKPRAKFTKNVECELRRQRGYACMLESLQRNTSMDLLCMHMRILLTRSQVGMYTCTFISFHTYIHIYRYIDICTYIDIYIYTYIYTYIHINMYIYIYIVCVRELYEEAFTIAKV